MSPQSLTDDGPTEAVDPEVLEEPTATAVGPDCGAAARGDVGHARPRLTVRDLQIALDAARNSAGRPPVASRGALLTGLPESRPVTEDAASVRAEPWLPERDGPVSLAGLSAPRTRTVSRAIATADPVARRSPVRGTTTRASTAAAIDPALASAAAAAPPRLVVIAACGGAGASTATVLLAAALAPVTGALLLSSGADRGSLCVRANANSGDIDALTGWAAQHPGQLLRASTPGVASGNVGTGRLALAARGRDDPGRPFDADTAAGLLAAAGRSNAAVLLDWSCPTPPPKSIWTSATHVLVVAPADTPGLLDAEYVVQNLEQAIPANISLGALIVDVRGRAPRRIRRASLARLQTLDLPVTELPYDPALAEDPRVYWPALRPRTRSAVVATLTHLLRPDLHPDPHRKDQT